MVYHMCNHFHHDEIIIRTSQENFFKIFSFPKIQSKQFLSTNKRKISWKSSDPLLYRIVQRSTNPALSNRRLDHFTKNQNITNETFIDAKIFKKRKNSIFLVCSKRKKASVAVMSKEGTERVAAIAAKSGATDGGDPDHDPGLSHSWISRILRAALPFQLALVALFYAASLLEPHCCEATNTLNLSLTPQLRYVRGPPPVWTSRRPIVCWKSFFTRRPRSMGSLHGVHRSNHRRNPQSPSTAWLPSQITSWSLHYCVFVDMMYNRVDMGRYRVSLRLRERRVSFGKFAVQFEYSSTLSTRLRDSNREFIRWDWMVKMRMCSGVFENGEIFIRYFEYIFNICVHTFSFFFF